MRYMVVIERGENSWAAHVPDLPGSVAIGERREEALQLIREAIAFHIELTKRPPDAKKDDAPGNAWQ